MVLIGRGTKASGNAGPCPSPREERPPEGEWTRPPDGEWTKEMREFAVEWWEGAKFLS